jgi:hypothetical protein
MTSTLELAIEKASKLPEAAQEQIGLEMLERIAAIEDLRRELEIGIRELDAGLGQRLDIEDVKRRGRERLAKG